MSILSVLGNKGKIEFVGNLFHKSSLKKMQTQTKTLLFVFLHMNLLYFKKFLLWL